MLGQLGLPQPRRTGRGAPGSPRNLPLSPQEQPTPLAGAEDAHGQPVLVGTPGKELPTQGGQGLAQSHEERGGGGCLGPRTLYSVLLGREHCHGLSPPGLRPSDLG